MVFANRPTSMQLAFVATLLVHGAFFLVRGAETLIRERNEIAPIQLTTFRTDLPFIPGTPSAEAVKPKKTVVKSTKPTFAPTETVKEDSVTTQEAALDSSPSAGQGGVASSISAAGARATGDLRAIYLSELRARLEEVKHYPLQARRLGQTGSVEVAFKVHPDGSIEDARIIRPSPFNRLNESALATVASLKKFRPLPESFGSDPLMVTLPIRYSIRN